MARSRKLARLIVRSRKLARLIVRSAVVLGAILLFLGVFFTQTPMGKTLVLREVLRRVEGAIAGEIVVDGISSSGLLRGFTFRGIRILGEDGRPFLEADSIMAGLSPRPLLSGDLILTRVAIWSPRIRLERFPDQERLNVVSIFLPGSGDGQPGEASPGSGAEDQGPSGEEGSIPAPDSLSLLPEADPPAKGRRTIAFRSLRIFDGTLHILLPAPPGGLSPARSLVELAPDGTSQLRRLSFRDIQLEMPEGVIRSPEQEGESFEVEALSFVGEIWPRSFRVEGLQGEMRREPGRLEASVEEIRLPSSQARGQVAVGWGDPRGAWVSVQGDSDGLALQDLHSIEPRLPRGVARGPFEFRMGREGVLLDFLGTRLTLSQGSLQARGGLLLGSPLSLRALNLSLNQVDLAIMDPWLPDSLPLRGRVAGDLNLEGTAVALEVAGDLSLSRPDSSGITDARIDGTFHFGDGLGVTDLSATLAPLDWGTFADLSPAMTLRGPGALRLDATGSLREGIQIDLEATHVPAGMAPSRVTARGVVQSTEEDLFLSLRGELGPLSFTSLRRFFPELPLTGEVSGPVAVRGNLSDLTVETELLTSAGPLGLEAHFDARRPAEHYSLNSDFQEFLLSSLVPALPEPTRLTGRLVASGRGFTLDSLAGEATVFLRRGEVGFLRVDTAALVARVEEGLLRLDTLIAETGVGRLEAGGAFGVSPSAPAGDLTVQVESESLVGFRPLLMGEIPLILDDLTPFERDLLLVEEVDLDTIPTAAEVAVDGSVEGRAVLTGGVRNFSAEGALTVRDLRYRTEYLEGGELTFSASELPGEGRRMQGTFFADSLNLRNLSFRGGEAEFDLGMRDGRVRLTALREEEEYRARGTYALDSVGGRVNLDDLNIRLDTVRWNLGGPTSLEWSPDGIHVRDFRLIRPGLGNMRIEVDGHLPLRGEGDFSLMIQEVRLERVAQIGQLENPLEGTVDLWLTVSGRADDPTVEGSLFGEGLRYGPYHLSGLDSEFSYQNLRLDGEAWLSDGGRQVLMAEGSIPADLRIRTDGPRIPEGLIDLDLAVDSFPAALALVVVEALEEVEGALSGQVHLGGTPEELAPVGALYLGGGSVFLPALGVGFEDVEAAFGLNPDGRVEVEGSLRSGGLARVTGSVNLHPLTDPTLNLTVDATDLLATARRDVQARLSGQIRVLNTYRRPRVEGELTVEQGVLMVEELARSAEVVNLSDPSFIDVVEQETTLRPVLQASQNPFLQNLMLAVDLSMTRDGWLRGQDLNVEMSGDVSVFWDRTERDLALVGDLQAIRGVYTVLGRQFQVQNGIVSFQGTPGVNPNLDIEALHRLRPPGGEVERLDITATVGGTLLSPRVTLTSSSAAGIAESDLVSYLIFGRPSYALASGHGRAVEGAAGSLLGAAGGAGLNFTLGAFGSQLSSVVARDFGLDFLAISQGEYVDPFGVGGWEGTVATTQVEIGQYITDDVFAALLWRPLNSLGGSSRNQFAGLRVEWRPVDLWTLEGFIEDRYARSPLFAYGDFLSGGKVKGFSFWREWGY